MTFALCVLVAAVPARAGNRHAVPMAKREPQNPLPRWQQGIAPDRQLAPAPQPQQQASDQDWFWMVDESPNGHYRRAAARAATLKWGPEPCNDKHRANTMRRLLALQHYGVHASNLAAIALGHMPWPH